MQSDVEFVCAESDPDGVLDLTSVTIVGLPGSGMATQDPVTGQVLYVHDGSATSSESFLYSVDDALGVTSNIAMVDVVVTSSPPVAITSDLFWTRDRGCEFGASLTRYRPRLGVLYARHAGRRYL